MKTMKGYNIHSTCVVQGEHGGKSTREGSKNGVGRRERMKHEVGMKDREERSKGIEIHIADAFTIIKPTTPFKFVVYYESLKRELKRILTHYTRHTQRLKVFLFIIRKLKRIHYQVSHDVDDFSVQYFIFNRIKKERVKERKGVTLNL